MKRSLVTILFSVLYITCMAQFKIGVNVGGVVNDNSEFYGAQFGVDVYKMWGKQDGLLNFGLATGFMTFSGKDVEILGQEFETDNANYIPLGGAARITLLGFLRVGTDIGYSFSLNEDGDGGFYLRPIAGIDLFDAVEVNAFFQSIVYEEVDVNSIGASLLFQFGGK